jgi:hypothetical protein
MGCILPAFSQTTTQSSAISNKVYISIARELPKPPYLEINDLYFEDTDGNNKIDSEETATFHFILNNSGLGTGVGLELWIAEKNNIQGLDFVKSQKLPDLKNGENRKYAIPVNGLGSLQTGIALFSIEAREANGFHSDPVQIEVATEAFKEPLVKVVDYQVSSQNSGTLEKRKPFDVEILVQNIGQGVARDVSVNLNLPMHVFCLSANESEIIGSLEPGQKKLVSYNLVTNNEYSQPVLGMKFNLNEKHRRYSENRDIELMLNQRVSTEKLVIEGSSRSNINIEVGSLTSDIDRNIPEVAEKNPYKIALIIGNENYAGNLNPEINVDYARRDAETFRTYAIRTLGVEERNAYFITDATSGAMKREIDRVTELVKRMGPETELIFFYAGHGYPDEKLQAPYIIPVDVTSSNLSSAIPLEEVYRKFSDTGAKKVTVLLDACFSGGGRNQGLLAARAVRIKPKEESIGGNMLVFSASTGEQSALPYHSQKHGIFSYFLMKKLQDTQGQVTFGEMADYLRSRIGVESLRVNGKSQDPTVIVSPQLFNVWEGMNF